MKQLEEFLKYEDVLAHIYADMPEAQLISDFRDGSAHKSNKFLQEQNTIHIKLYIDDFTIINPLSNKAKVHKICGIYWTIGNIPNRFTSKLYTIQLLALTKSFNIKKNMGFIKYFKKLFRI